MIKIDVLQCCIMRRSSLIIISFSIICYQGTKIPVVRLPDRKVCNLGCFVGFGILPYNYIPNYTVNV